MDRIDTLLSVIDTLIWLDDDEWVRLLYKELCELHELGYDVQINNQEFWEHVYGIQSGSGAVDFRNYFEIEPMHYTKVRRFNTNGRSYNVRFRNLANVPDFRQLIRNLLNSVLEQALADATENDWVGLQINHPTLNMPIIIPFRRRNMLTADLILNIIERIQQSRIRLRFDDMDPMIFKFTIVSPPAGQGRYRRAHFVNHDEWYTKKIGHSILPIKNRDKLCCARAIVTAMARVDEDIKYKSITKGDQGWATSEQKRRADKLMNDVGLKDHKGACSIEELQKFQDYLSDYEIKVFSKEHLLACIFSGPVKNKKLLLYVHDDHYDVIIKIEGFFGNAFWCHKCNHGFDHKEDHKCTRGECFCCNNTPICQFVKWIFCSECNRYFQSQSCFDNHKIALISKGNKKVKTLSLCQKLFRCKTCDVLVKSRLKNQHHCYHYKCKMCEKDILKNEKHLCYMPIMPFQDYELKLKARRPVFIFFDLETRQDTCLENQVYQHIPNLIVAHRVCDKCKDNESLSSCTHCRGENEHIFDGINCLENFCEWLFCEENRGATAIAHNARGFDTQFVLQYLHEQGSVPPNIISRGLEVIMLEAGGVRIIDSLSFLPMALSAMPKTFGFEEQKKGYYPHFFNTLKNENYIGPMPELDYYGINHMKPDAREKLIKWHAEQKDRIFDNKKELLAYCKSDVTILRLCVLKFREIFLETTNTDPLLMSLTIASACNLVFRKNFLRFDTIGLIPNGGYNHNEKQSAIALKWLLWLEKKENCRIQHKLNGGEKWIEKYRVDGFLSNINDGSGRIFEFHGCYWHGCLKCIKERHTVQSGTQLTADEALQRTLDRTNRFQQLGYSVQELWECDLKKELNTNKEMKDFFNTCQVTEPIDPRESFFGGRTNSIKLFHECEDGEKIHYVDVCSLYPYVCKYGMFPLGHPTIHTTVDMEKINKREYKGLIKCTILPPTNLFIPLLPIRCNKKLMFVLCKTCAQNYNIDPCDHTDEQRSLTCVWTHLELYKSLELGYKIMKVHEVWNYDIMDQYDSASKQGGIFTQYINCFLKLKQQADGLPMGIKIEDYVAEYEKVEGIKLDMGKIEKNPGLRALAKLCLNSFWGKFGQRNNLGQTKYFTEPAQFHHLLNDETKEVSGVSFYGDTLATVQYTTADDFVEILSNTNVVIASFVTSQARLKLYSYLEKLQERVLYFDTDSVIYLSRPNDNYNVPLGNYLGEMTSELSNFGQDAYINSFVGAGAKNYAYRVVNNSGNLLNETCKIRGFTLDFECRKSLNFDSMKEMVAKFVLLKDLVRKDINQFRICRNNDRSIVSKICTKQYGIVYDKRIVKDDYSTLPYGYRTL